MNRDGDEAMVSLMMWVGVGSLLATVVLDLWIHWLCVLPAFVISGWAAQAASKPKKKKGGDRK